MTNALIMEARFARAATALLQAASGDVTTKTKALENMLNAAENLPPEIRSGSLLLVFNETVQNIGENHELAQKALEAALTHIDGTPIGIQSFTAATIWENAKRGSDVGKSALKHALETASVAKPTEAYYTALTLFLKSNDEELKDTSRAMARDAVSRMAPNDRARYSSASPSVM